MKRNTSELSRNVYDLVIVGGGIYGAWVAWDAALRGLSVALVDKGDFGSATSSNSLKVIHGGLRYLQHADFRRLRRSICERNVLMRIAPHLVHPLPFLMPTYGNFMRGKEIMFLALIINDWIGFDRNRLNCTEKHLPNGHVISKNDCVDIFPGVNKDGLTGGAIWHDCQIYNTERMLLSILRSAEKAGAHLANYVKVNGFIISDNDIKGVRAKDVLSDEEFDIRGKIVVNTSGPWVDSLLYGLNGNGYRRRVLLSKTMNLVVRRQLIPKYAVGVSSKFEFKDNDAILTKVSRLLFIVPWRQFSLIGTTHKPYDRSPDDFNISEEDIQNFINEINNAYPSASLKREDVSFFHGGLLPSNGINHKTNEISLLKRYRVYDHSREDKINGLVSVIGVKYTEARGVAEKAVDLVFEKMNKKPPKSLTYITPVYGGQIESFNDFLEQKIKKETRGLSSSVIKQLIYNYGSEFPQVLKHIDENRDLSQKIDTTSQVIKAEVVHGIREEMAQKLADIILRRTELGSAGDPGDGALETCATIMGRELGWDKARIQREIKEVESVYSTHS